MQTNIPMTGTRQAAVNGLAVVGFIALVATGIYLAVYSTRFVPAVMDRIGAAAVYLGSVLRPSPASLSVVPSPEATTTIPFGAATTTTSTEPVKEIPAVSTLKPSAGVKKSTVEQIGGTATPAAPYGLPDLLVTVSAIGYLTTPSTDSFVASSSVPAGMRPAVKFTVTNIGTNVSGPWRFSAAIPTRTTYLYQSTAQQSLNPGESIDYTLGFDRASTGTTQPMTITANYDNTVTEFRTDNNSISFSITVLSN